MVAQTTEARKKVAGGATTIYIFSGSKVIAEYDNGAAVGSPSREYIYAGGALLAKIDSGGTKYYHQDHLSNRLVTDSSGNKFAEMGTFPYGESWYNASNDKLLFTTYERDSESGNDYAQARYHVSGLGRFSSPDPIAGSTSDPQSLNRYSYVRNMPVMLTDPFGTCPGGLAQNRDSNQTQSQDSKSGGPSATSSDSEGQPDPQFPSGPCRGFTDQGGGSGGGGGTLDWMDLGQIPGGLIGNGESNDTFLVPLGDSLGFNPWMVDPFGRGWQNPSNDCVSGLGSGDIYCGGAEDGGSEGGYGTSELDLYSLSGSGGWTINPKDLILKVTSDCFNKDAGRREVTYQLATQSGSPLVGSYNITEQQSDTSLTPPNPWGQSSNDPAVDGNAFNDILQPGLYSSQTVKSTQYFLVSPGGLDIAQWVPISRPGQALSKFNTIVMQGPLSSNPNTVKINGRAAPLCGFI